MDEFGYLSVLISIILGLGITQLLSGFGRLIGDRSRVRPYGPALAWAVFLLIVHVQTWWSMFGMRAQADWSFGGFAVVLLQPVLLYLLAALVLPAAGESGPLDLRQNYFSQRRWFFGLLVALLFTSVLKDLVLAGALPEPVNLAFHLLMLATATGAMATEREAYHCWIAYSGPLLIVVYISVLFARLE